MPLRDHRQYARVPTELADLANGRQSLLLAGPQIDQNQIWKRLKARQRIGSVNHIDVVARSRPALGFMQALRIFAHQQG